MDAAAGLAGLGAALMRGCWHLIGHRCELPAPGDYLAVSTAFGDLVVFNDEGSLVAFDNRCPHRGARWYDSPAGQQRASCPYHGWSYRRGRVCVAGRRGFDGDAVDGARLNAYTLAFCGDFVFVGIAPVQSLEAQLGGLFERLASWSMAIERRHDLNAYAYECTWPVALENALEAYHVSEVHPESLGLLRLDAGVDAFHGQNSSWDAAIGDERMVRQIQRVRRLFAPGPGLTGYANLHVFPFAMVSTTGGLSFAVQHFFPGAAPGTTAFSSRLYAAKPADARAGEALAGFFTGAAELNRRVFEEDHAICRRVPADTWSTEPLRFAARSEARIQHFRAACRDWTRRLPHH